MKLNCSYSKAEELVLKMLHSTDIFCSVLKRFTVEEKMQTVLLQVEAEATTSPPSS